MKPSQQYDLQMALVPAHHPHLIVGQPGVGKTDITMQVCKALGYRTIVSYPVVADPTDASGIPFPDREGTHARRLPIGQLNDVLTARKPTVWVLDDLGQAPPATQAAYMQALLARRIGDEAIPDCVSIVACTNRTTDRAGVHTLLEPVKSRFVTIVTVEPDFEDWRTWALKQKDFPFELIGFVQLRQDCLRDFKPTGSMENTCSPRTLHSVAKLMQAKVPAHLEYEAFSGAIGSGRAAELRGYLQVYRNLPDLDDIVRNPKKAEVPEKPDVRCALAVGLANIACEKNFGAICTYAGRLPEDYDVLCVTMALRKVPALITTKAAEDWAEKHPEVVFGTTQDE